MSGWAPVTLNVLLATETGALLVTGGSSVTYVAAVQGGVANWSSISTTQTPGWGQVSDSQTPNWSSISTTQTPGWGQVSDSQTPNWTDITT